MIIILLIGILCLYKSSFLYPIARKGKDRAFDIDKLLQFQYSLKLKGFLSVIIMSGHIINALNITFLWPLKQVGVLAASIFFFLSGYGIMKSFLKKAYYLKHFLSNHFIKILTPCILAYIFQLILFKIFFYMGIKATYSQSFFVFLNWFIYVILLCYTLFYICFRFFTPIRAIIILTSILSALMCVGYACHLERLLWGGALCFPIGLFVAQFSSRCSEYISNNITVILVGSFIIFIISTIAFLYYGEYSFLGDFLGRNISTICTIPIFLIIFNVIKINNRVCEFLGEISYEIYIIHLVYTRIVLNQQGSFLYKEIFSILILSFSILTAYLLHHISKKIIAILVKKPVDERIE